MEEMVIKDKFMNQKYFWNNKNVLITGHSGFKGSWLTLWLNMLGAKVTGISLKPIQIQIFLIYVILKIFVIVIL